MRLVLVLNMLSSLNKDIFIIIIITFRENPRLIHITPLQLFDSNYLILLIICLSSLHSIVNLNSGCSLFKN